MKPLAETPVVRALAKRLCRVGAAASFCTGLSEALSITCSIVFFAAAIGKAFAPADAERLASVLIDPIYAALLIRVLVVAEWAVGTLLLFERSRAIGLMCAVCALALFTLILLHAHMAGYTGGCGCLGVDSTLPQAIARNGVPIVIAGGAIWFHKGQRIGGDL